MPKSKKYKWQCACGQDPQTCMYTESERPVIPPTEDPPDLCRDVEDFCRCKESIFSQGAQVFRCSIGRSPLTCEKTFNHRDHPASIAMLQSQERIIRDC
jgi:hypothetical protein